MKSWIFICVACVALSGCTNPEWHSIDRSFSPSTGDSRLIDAKQRAIISIVGVDDQGKLKHKGTCAEPSPDALQATAAALSGSGNLSKEEVTAALNLALGSTESAASIGLRTQTIQVLRDAYYRVCEEFLNKGDEVDYTVETRRLINNTIAYLAVEQITGVVKAQQVALTSQSTADAGAQLGVLTAELRKQREELNELRKRDQALADEIAVLDEEIGKEGISEDEKNELEATKKAKESDKETLKTLISDQEKTVSTLQSAVEKASLKTITAQSTTSATPIGGGDGTAQARQLTSEVTKAVTDITLAALGQDYTGQMCTEAFRSRNRESSGGKGATRVSGSTTTTAKAGQGTTIASNARKTTTATEGTSTAAVWEATPPADDVFRTFCHRVLTQMVVARIDLTAAAIRIEEAKATACKDMAALVAGMVTKLKKDITVEEASTVLATIGKIQDGCASGLTAPPHDVKNTLPVTGEPLELF